MPHSRLPPPRNTLPPPTACAGGRGLTRARRRMRNALFTGLSCVSARRADFAGARAWVWGRLPVSSPKGARLSTLHFMALLGPLGPLGLTSWPSSPIYSKRGVEGRRGPRKWRVGAMVLLASSVYPSTTAGVAACSLCPFASYDRAESILTRQSSQTMARSGFPHAFWPQSRHVNLVLLSGPLGLSPGR